jgi:hypothetical protein
MELGKPARLQIRVIFPSAGFQELLRKYFEESQYAVNTITHALSPCLYCSLLSYDWDERTGLSREYYWNMSARHLGQSK